MNQVPATRVTRAWSCTVRLVVADGHCIDEAQADLDVILEKVDRAASRFRANSNLSLANCRAGRPTAVSRLLIRLVACALDAAKQTSGAVDPTIGRSLVELGYDRDISRVSPYGASVAPIRPAADWRRVRLDADAGLLTVPSGVALDLGATAKAWTADYAANALHRSYGTAVLVELGGDLAVRGNRENGWPIEVAENESDPADCVLLHQGGLATSTTTIRRWMRGDVEVHHILDPRTGAPVVGPWRTATVAGSTALAANTASTGALVLGDAALGWLEQRAIAARLVARDGDVVTTSGWPQPAVNRVLV